LETETVIRDILDFIFIEIEKTREARAVCYVRLELLRRHNLKFV